MKKTITALAVCALSAAGAGNAVAGNYNETTQVNSALQKGAINYASQSNSNATLQAGKVNINSTGQLNEAAQFGFANILHQSNDNKTVQVSCGCFSKHRR